MKHSRGYSKFKTIEHPQTKRTAEIKVDKRMGWFRCEIGDASKESKNLTEVEMWANGLLGKSEKKALDWIPVIKADVDEDSRGHYRRDGDNDMRGVGVKISASRFYIAMSSRDPNGRETWRTLNWAQCDPDSPDRLPEEQFWEMSTKFREPSESDWHGVTPAQKKGLVRLPEVNGGNYLLKYTPDLWAGIQHVIDVVERESKVLDKLFSTKDGRETLGKIGTQPELLRLTDGAKK